MIPLRRLAFLLLPACLVLCIAAPRGETQVNNQEARFAFADTTLLRDTLGLTFERLFPLADSLRMDAASLKALSVGYRWSLERLVKMADSLDVPIDSVGPIIQREQFNPLASAATNTSLTYETHYNRLQNSSSWSNTGRYTLRRGGIYLTNDTDVQFEKYRSTTTQTLTQRRDWTTSANWVFSPRFSLGAQADLNGYDNIKTGGVNNENERVNTFTSTFHSVSPTWNGLKLTLNGTGGAFNSTKLAERKEGLTASFGGQLRYGFRDWVSNDFRFSFEPKISKASGTDPDPGDDITYPRVQSRDNSSNLSGTFGLFRSRPVEFVSNYRLSNVRTHSPLSVNPDTLTGAPAATIKQLVRNEQSSVDGTIRIQQSANRSLSLGLNSTLANNATANNILSNISRDRSGFTAAGRYDLGPARLDGTFQLGQSIARYPRRDPKGGYREDAHSRSLGGRMNLVLTRSLTFELSGDISLTQSRYAKVDSPLTIPVANDAASQNYRMQLGYRLGTRGGTTVSFGHTRSQSVNLPASSTASNSETRSYSAGWTWNYQLLTGLTASQVNTMTADYLSYPFAPASNRLQLSYTTETTLDAVLTTPLTLKVRHFLRSQPKGNYRPAAITDPTEYFSLSDEDLTYSLSVDLGYRPSPPISFNFKPAYNASARNTTTNDELLPQRISRSLTIQGYSNLNVPVGTRGRVTGYVSRDLTSSSSISYSSSGVVSPSRSDVYKWNANVAFTWTL